MSALLFHSPRFRPLDDDGNPYPGALAYFFLTTTTTPTDTYEDAALGSAHTNPVEADDTGLFPAIYLNPLITYKLTLKTAAGALIYTEDPVSDALTSLGNSQRDVSGSGSITTADKDAVIRVTATATQSLPAAATAGTGFRVIIANRSSGIVTITPNGAETINGNAASIFLGLASSVLLTCNGTAWLAHVMGCEASSYTATQTGYAASLTPTVKWKKSGDLVTLFFASASTGTSNAVTMTFDIPATLTPANTVTAPVRVVDNGTNALGMASISGTTVTLGLTAAVTGGFTGSGTKGFPAGAQIVYSLG